MLCFTFLVVIGFAIRTPVIVFDQHDCKFTLNGTNGDTVFDLSAIRGKVFNGPDSRTSTYHYALSMCQDIQEKCEDIMTGMDVNGAAYQYGGEPGGGQVCWDVLGSWSEEPTVHSLDDQYSGNTGFALSFQNGDVCREKRRTMTINVMCSVVEQMSGKQDTTDSCHFIFALYTSHACTAAAQLEEVN